MSIENVFAATLTGVLERICREIGSWLVTAFVGGVINPVLGFWTFLLKHNPDVISPEQVLKAPAPTVAKLLANQIFDAWLCLSVMSFVLALLWLLLVRLHRPTSPLEAVKFRKYWMAIATLLFGCTFTFYGSALYGPLSSAFFPQIQDLKDIPKLLLFVALALSALAFLYVLSMLRAPPTVIAAVPFGGYFARLRWS